MNMTSSVSQDANILPEHLEWNPADKTPVSRGGGLLGQGAFGTVHKGRYNGTTVAIKVIRDGGNETSAHHRIMHRNEIRRLQDLHFRHIVQLYGSCDAPSVSQEPLIVSECMEGGSLLTALQAANAAEFVLDDPSFVQISLHICRGLRYLHGKHVTHSDMKPANVLLTEKLCIDLERRRAFFAAHCVAKLADFGLSKRLQRGTETRGVRQSHNASNQIGFEAFGTLPFMAPECFEGMNTLTNQQLKAVDVYAFGMVMYQMLTGYSPWSLENVHNQMMLLNLLVAKRERPGWGPRESQIRQEYKELVTKCWSHDAAERPTVEKVDELLSNTRVVQCPEVSELLMMSDGAIQLREAWNNGWEEHISAKLNSQSKATSEVMVDWFALAIELLDQLVNAQGSSGAPKAGVAASLCETIAEGLHRRRPSQDTLAAIPIVLDTFHAFPQNRIVNVAAAYALSRLLKVSNNIQDVQMRQEIADWLSHIMSSNLQAEGSEHHLQLASIIASAARNFIWKREANATTFYSAAPGIPVPAKTLCDALSACHDSPDVAKACLSVLAVLGYFPQHRATLASLGVVGCTVKVMQTELSNKSRFAFKFALAVLGILAATPGPSSADDRALITSALIEEGGAAYAVAAVERAVQCRNLTIVEEGLYAVTSLVYFDRALGEHVAQVGGVATVVRAVWLVGQVPAQEIGERCAEMMCSSVIALSEVGTAAAQMHRRNLQAPLTELVLNFGAAPRVSVRALQAIERVR